MLVDNEFTPTDTLQVTGCTFSENVAVYQGGALSVDSSNIAFTDCTLSGNEAGEGGAIFMVVESTAMLTSCDFHENSAGVGGAVSACCDVWLTISGCTFAENTADHFGAVFVAADFTDWQISNSIIAFNTGPEVIDGPCEFECTDIYGNEGGDWVGCYGDQNGINGNFSLDPLFCGDEGTGGPYALQEDSPCLPGNHPYEADCGLIAAHGNGCAGVVGSPPGGADFPIATFCAVPNPFRGLTEFRFTTPPASGIDLTVFDVSGRIVRSFVLPARSRGVR
jgi:hypothetical protein